MHRGQIIIPPDARILVVKLATIGDLLLATPSLRALRETYPQAHIDLLVTPASAGLLDDWTVIDRVIVLDKYLFDYPQQLLKNPRNLFRLRLLWHDLRDGTYDAVLLLHHLTLFYGRLKHQILMRATGAKWRIGLDNGHGWFLNVRVKDNGFGVMHEADYNLAVAKAAGATTDDKYLTVPINEEEYQQARQLLYETDPKNVGAGLAPARPNSPAISHPPAKLEEHPGIKRPIIAMHPGSGGYSTARRWAPERFAQLADTLFYDTGGQLILMGGPEEAELHQQIFELMQSGMPVRSFAGKGNIRVAAAILEQADLFIGNDSGLMHLATAVGTPTVAIFGLTNSDAWGPYTGGLSTRQAVVVKMDLPCMPCFYRGHDLGTPEGCMTRDCLAMLDVDPVATAARRLLRQSYKQPHLVGESMTNED
ncbi:MAG TPA: glycosyltransferase family 9 protein [Ktedonobacteraceae bacterium]|nr:glycosyltransferase family 9 protein [Ktedonobacteraceae bacterium]